MHLVCTYIYVGESISVWKNIRIGIAYMYVCSLIYVYNSIKGVSKQVGLGYFKRWIIKQKEDFTMII